MSLGKEIPCEILEGNKVRCNACSHRCVIADGGSGICAVRVNNGGKLFLSVYGQAMCANGRDPIEKKRLNSIFEIQDISFNWEKNLTSQLFIMSEVAKKRSVLRVSDAIFRVFFVRIGISRNVQRI